MDDMIGYLHNMYEHETLDSLNRGLIAMSRNIM